jgi:hypothetical protein
VGRPDAREVRRPGKPWDFAEAVTRETPVKLFAKTLVDLSCQVMMRADPASTIYAAWVDAHWSRTAVLDLLVLNSKITTEGAQGIRGEFLVSLSDDAAGDRGHRLQHLRPEAHVTANGLPKSVVMGASSTPTFSTIAV